MDYSVRKYRNMEPDWLNDVANEYQPSMSRHLIVVKNGEEGCISSSVYMGGPNVITEHLEPNEFFQNSPLFDRKVTNLTKNLVIDFFSDSAISGNEEILNKIKGCLPSNFQVKVMDDPISMQNYIIRSYD